MEYKRNKENVAYGVVYRCKGQELVFPYIDEGEENVLERYIVPTHGEVVSCPDIHLSEEKERELGEAQYFSICSRLSRENEEVLREDFGIGSDFELIFLDETTLVSQASTGCLSFYLAQL